MANSEHSGITWLLVGGGRRSHAFLGDDTRYAYCGVGPGGARVPDDGTHCQTCERRLARIAAQERARQENWG